MSDLEKLKQEPRSKNASWDLFFLNDDLRYKIENTLDKYEVEYKIEYLTHTLLDNPEDHLTDYFIEKLDEFLFSCWIFG